jgi:hypothetical protein
MMSCRRWSWSTADVLFSAYIWKTRSSTHSLHSPQTLERCLLRQATQTQRLDLRFHVEAMWLGRTTGVSFLDGMAAGPANDAGVVFSGWVSQDCERTLLGTGSGIR